MWVGVSYNEGQRQGHWKRQRGSERLGKDCLHTGTLKYYE